MKPTSASSRMFCRWMLGITIVLLLLSIPVYTAIAEGPKGEDGYKIPNQYETERQECEKKHPKKGTCWNPFNWGNCIKRGLCKAWSYIKQGVDWVVKILLGPILAWLKSRMLEVFEKLGAHMVEVIIYLTPNLNDPSMTPVFADVHRTIFTILVPFYSFNIILVGIYFLFTSVEPAKRAKAKDMLQTLIVSMVLVSVSPALYRILIDASNIISREMMDVMKTQTMSVLGTSCGGPSINFFGVFLGSAFTAVLANPGFSLFFVMVLFLFYLMILLFLAVRYAMIIIFYLLFPFTVFCYFFEYTKNLGGDLLSRSIMWILCGPIMALMVAITVFVAAATVNFSISGGASCGKVTGISGSRVSYTAGVPPWQRHDLDRIEIRSDTAYGSTTFGGLSSGEKSSMFHGFMLLLILMAGFTGILLVPLMMTGMMKWVGAGIAASGMNRMAKAEGRTERWKAFGMISAGNYMMGQGSRSLVSAGVQASRARPDRFEQTSNDMIPSWSELKSGAGRWASGGGPARMLGAGSGGSQSGGGILSQAAAPLKAVGGLLGGIKESFSTAQDKQDAAAAEFMNVMGLQGQELVGAPYQKTLPGGSISGGGGAAGKYADQVNVGEGVPQSPLRKAPGISASTDASGEPIGVGADRYTSGLATDYSIKTTETDSWLVPKLGIFDRIDSMVAGSRTAMRSLFTKSGTGAGQSMGSRMGQFAKGEGKVLWAMRPLSIFFPVRIAGAMIYNIGVELLPPFFHPHAYWIGKKMSGMGVRAAYDKVSEARLWNVERNFNNAGSAEERERYGRQYATALNGYAGDKNYGIYMQKLSTLQGSNAALFDYYMQNSRSGKSVGEVREGLDGFMKNVSGSSNLAEFKTKHKKDQDIIFAGMMYHMGMDKKKVDDLTDADFTALKQRAGQAVSDDDLRRVYAGMDAHAKGFEGLEDKRRFMERLGGGGEGIADDPVKRGEFEERGVKDLVEVSDGKFMTKQYVALGGSDLQSQRDFQAAGRNELFFNAREYGNLRAMGYSENEARRMAGTMNLKLWRSGSGNMYLENSQMNYLRRKGGYDTPSYSETMADEYGVGLKKSGTVNVVVGYDGKLSPQVQDVGYDEVIIHRLTYDERAERAPVVYTDGKDKAKLDDAFRQSLGGSYDSFDRTRQMHDDLSKRMHFTEEDTESLRGFRDANGRRVYSDEQILQLIKGGVDAFDASNAGVGQVDRVRLGGISTYYRSGDANPAVVSLDNGVASIKINGAYIESLSARNPGMDQQQLVDRFESDIRHDMVAHEFRHDYALRRQDDIERELFAGMSPAEQEGYKRAKAVPGASGAIRETVANAIKFQGGQSRYEQDETAYKESVGDLLSHMQERYDSSEVLRPSDLSNMASLRVLAANTGNTIAVGEFDRIAAKVGTNSGAFRRYQTLGGGTTEEGEQIQGVLERIYAQEVGKQ
ncbi:MAG: ABC transporter permease [Candidatus Altiarchaeota archaeon]|nr:ABC transporter permease [Candidatus Altiarchaeota archaeon]